MLETISKHSMIEPRDKVTVAVSGGPDSTALLLALMDLSDKYNLELHVWHLNHLIRPEASLEADHVRRLASHLGLACTVEERDVKSYAKEAHFSVQEAGRQLRYELLQHLSERVGATKIAVGHNADDCVETFFINLIRGAGGGGLGGIPPVAGKVIRPLIECDRLAVLEFLKIRRIDFLTDSSNADKRYLRNRIRLELIPLLRTLSPTATDKIATTMSLLRDEETWLTALSQKSFRETAESRNGELRFDGALLAQTPPALRRRLLRLAIAELTGSDLNIDYKTVRSIVDKTLAGGGATNLSGGGQALMSGGDLIITRALAPFKSVLIDSAGGQAQIDHAIISVTIAPLPTVGLPPEKGVLLVDADKIDWPLEIRPRQPGDWFVPLGMAGKKKLHDFLVDEKVPRRLRDSVPIFVDRNKLAAVGNLRIDERVKITETTNSVAVLRTPDFIY